MALRTDDSSVRDGSRIWDSNFSKKEFRFLNFAPRPILLQFLETIFKPTSKKLIMFLQEIIYQVDTSLQLLQRRGNTSSPSPYPEMSEVPKRERKQAEVYKVVDIAPVNRSVSIQVVESQSCPVLPNIVNLTFFSDILMELLHF